MKFFAHCRYKQEIVRLRKMIGVSEDGLILTDRGPRSRINKRWLSEDFAKIGAVQGARHFDCLNVRKLHLADVK